MRKRVVRLCLVCFAGSNAALLRADEPLRVAAAISLQEALTTLAAEFEKQEGGKVELNFGSSGQLLVQVRNGAPCDVFISAAREQVDELVKAGLADMSTLHVIARNDLVLAGRREAKNAPKRFEDLADPAIRRLAMGDPSTVPAGKYASQVLEHFKLTETLKDRIVYGKNARQVLDYVERGEVDAGIVYVTDLVAAAHRDADLQLLAAAERSWHDPIDYSAIALTGSNQSERCKAFLAMLVSHRARKVLWERGFVLLAGEPGATPASPSPPSSAAPSDKRP